MSPSSAVAIDQTRRTASEQLDPQRRAELGQYMTPSAIANFMASLFKHWPQDTEVLDPGAGIGSLSEAFATRFLADAPAKSRLHLTAYEIDPLLSGYLAEHLTALEERGRLAGQSVHTTKFAKDFITAGSFEASFAGSRYTHVILNPPYKKIGADSEYRKLLRGVGIETVNLYTAFLGLSVSLTKVGGEVVAIIPRSFCNGTYFRPFRQWLLEHAAIAQIHVFESRKKAFAEDDVLQENVIVHLVRGAKQGQVIISTSHDATFADYEERRVPFTDVVKSADRERFIHIPLGDTTEIAGLFSQSLVELDLDVATGPVVDFRLQDHWLAKPTKRSAPLLYMHHFTGGEFRWPVDHRKPNAISVNDDTRKWLMPNGWYAITKRFSAKEERRRIVAYVVDPTVLPHKFYGFENHFNVVHHHKGGLSEVLARGMALFLNSTVVDQHFRTFSGHTQVNATDLRAMRYPSRAMLERFGAWSKKHQKATQAEIDQFIAATYATK